MGFNKDYYPDYGLFIQETADIKEITGTVDYYGWFRSQDGDNAYTTSQLLNLDRWTILRITISGGVSTYEWAGGDWSKFNQNWNNRASIATYQLRKWK